MFTDIEGSTRLVQGLGTRWKAILEKHDEIARAAVTRHDGVVVRTEGDAVFAVFAGAHDAVGAAVDLQRDLAAHPWPSDGTISVRIGLHTGVGALGGGDYIGLDVHRAARIAATGHGGQIVVSEATALLVEQSLPDGVRLRDLGKHRLKDLSEREAIFQVVIEGVSDEFPPIRTLERIAHNLPVQVTSFVGREDEIATAVGLLEKSHILTLLGPGGTGKTRLALQIAAECADRFEDGTYFVPLAAADDPDLVPSEILSALGVPASTRRHSPREHLVDFFASRCALIVLDNMEQVVAAGGVVSDLVRSSPESRILVTSRVPLRIAGEQEMPIAPLAVTPASADPGAIGDSPAVRLFVDRAVAVRPDFELTADNAPAIAALVASLDGLPLAIELVVPQLRMLPIEAVLQRLDPSRLGGAQRDAPERHQTLWNAISWSVEDLPGPVRSLFARLSVFVGGGRLEEAEAVCADALDIDVLEGIGVLVERSLLVIGEPSVEIRFRWLRVIREYAHEMLVASGEQDRMEAAHARACLALAEQAESKILGPDRLRWIEMLDRDHDNMRAAMNRFVTRGEADAAFRLGWAMWRFWQARGHIHEARSVMERVLALDGGSPALRAKAMEAKGGVAWWQGDLDEADRLYRETLAVQRELGDPAEIANALYNAALTLGYGSQNPGAALPMLAEAEELYEGIGDTAGLANVHWGQGSLGYREFADALGSRRKLEKAIDGYRATGNVFGAGWANFELGALLVRMGKVDEAEPHLRRGLTVLWESRDYSAVVMFAAIFGWAAFQRGDMDRAMRLTGAAYALRDHSGVELMSIEANRIEGLSADDVARLEGDAAEWYQAGRLMGYAETVEFALRQDGPVSA